MWINGIWLIFVARVVWLVDEFSLTVMKFCEWQCMGVVMNESELSDCPLTVYEGSNTVTEFCTILF